MAISHLLSFTTLILCLAFFPTLLFSLSLPNFDGNLLLTGDAKLTTGSGTSVHLTATNTTSSSSGLILRLNPFKFAAFPRSRRSNPNPVSFSTDFTFSIPQHNVDGLALVILPANFLPRFKHYGLSMESKYFAVEFDTFVNEDAGDVNANHVGIDVNSLVSMKTSNVSSIGLVLNSGVKLRSWIDYDSSGKRLEVRLSKFGSPRPYSPLLACIIDLGEMWKGQEVLFGLSSSNGDGVSLQSSEIYSWKFKTRVVPKWLHSKPVDPSTFSNERAQDKVYYTKKSKGCLSWILLSLICGMSVTLGVLFLWLMFAGNDDRVTVIPMNLAANTGEFRYAKINVVVDDSSKY